MPSKRKTDTDTTRQPRQPEDTAVEATPEQAQQADSSAPDEDQQGVPGEPKEPAEPSETERRLEEMASQLEELNNARVRLAADFENYKKRVRQEQLGTMRFAAATVAERLLPVLDDADLALSHAPPGVDESWLKGIRLTFQKLHEVLASVGVERIDAVGVPFDPNRHEAVGSEETAEHPEDTVVVELRPGYRMHDRVLRPALVKVARPPA